MNSFQSVFSRRKVIIDKLEPFGFRRTENAYIYKGILPDSGFEITVTVTAGGEVCVAVIDPAFNELYTLHLAKGTTGGFVGSVRTETEKLLKAISEKCFEPDIFKCEQAKKLVEYARMRYGDELEFLWAKFPDNAVWRRKDTAKWYGALLTVSKRKLGIKSDESVEIIDLRAVPDNINILIDNKTYFHGWHMNKNNWYTIILDDSVSIDELCHRLDESYLLATK